MEITKGGILWQLVHMKYLVGEFKGGAEVDCPYVCVLVERKIVFAVLLNFLKSANI